jgi:hypothetical protein
VSNRLGPELEALIGTEALVHLAEAFGGTRLYVPAGMGAAHPIAEAIGLPAARKLSERLAPDTIRVPLAREQRARHYRAHGRSNGQIASALGMTEPGVNALFKRLDGAGTLPAKGCDRQLSLL